MPYISVGHPTGTRKRAWVKLRRRRGAAEAARGGAARRVGAQKLFALPRPGSFEMRTGNSPILIGAGALKPALLHDSFGICAIIGPPATS